MNEEYNAIQKIVEASRQALECAIVKSSLSTLADFPNGSCGDASLLVGNMLTLLGFADFHIMYGEIDTTDENEYPVLKTHAWLENDKYLIDITADQFPSITYYIAQRKTVPTNEHLGYVPVRKGEIHLGFTAIAWPRFTEAFDAFITD